MDFSQLIRKRRACHHFQANRSIPKEVLEAIVEETALTPSGYNAQPWEFVILQDPERLKKLKEIAFDQKHLEHASAVVVVLADTHIGRNVERLLDDWIKYGYMLEEERPAYHNSIAKNRSFEKRKQMALRSTMMACMTLLLSAENQGLASCPMMGFSQWQLEEFLGLPDDRVIALMVALGYEEEGKALPRLPRKSPDELIHWETFTNKEDPV